jgi:UTP--glucose-1-phosphate uridylyltransferase
VLQWLEHKGVQRNLGGKMTKVRKAVITAAGFGTRFLPQTKAMPKEMLPVVDKPVIQYIVEALVDAGIEDIIMVTGYHKRTIEDHFDLPSGDLIKNLELGGKTSKIDEMNKIANMANFIYIRQKGVYGTATPLLNAAHLIGDEPFIYTYADDIIISDPNPYKQIIDMYEKTGGNVMQCLQMTQDDEYSLYGVAGGEKVSPDCMKMDRIIEKPGKEKAPSDFAALGGYVFTPEVLGYLDSGLKNLKEGEEFWLSNDIIEPMLRDGKLFYGCLIKDMKRYDTGKKIEYMKTVVDFALQHDDIKDEFLSYLKTIVKD